MAGKDYRANTTKTAPQKQTSGRKPADLRDDKGKDFAKMPGHGLKNKGANNWPGIPSMNGK